MHFTRRLLAVPLSAALTFNPLTSKRERREERGERGTGGEREREKKGEH